MGAKNLVAEVIKQGGRLVPLILPNLESKGLGVMNPSIGIDGDGDLLVNLRLVNYAFYNNEHEQKFPSRWGPLHYMHPEDDLTLRTRNYLGRLDKDYQLRDIAWVDTSLLDKEPIWNFHGLEDARIVQWDSKTFITGVRRDTTTDGQGRMELSELAIEKKTWVVKEVARYRIPAPFADNSYCEKNWMPIHDKPFHYVKWSCPTEVVRADIGSSINCHQISLENGLIPPTDQRGSSHVIWWKGFWLAWTHEVDLTKNYLQQKNAKYRHRICVWDKNFRLIGLSNEFSFLDARVEFACGAVVFGDHVLVTFGFEDSTAFLLEIPEGYMDALVERIVADEKS